MAKSSSTRSRANQFKDFEKRATNDFDPEDDRPEFSESDSDESGDDRVLPGREHYVATDKSKLRRHDLAPLGSQYTGSTISRNGLLTEGEEHDPFNEFGSDEDSDAAQEDLETDTEELSVSNSENIDDADNGFDGEDITNGTSVDDADQDDDMANDAEEDMEDSRGDITDRTQLRQILNQDRGNIAATIAKAAQADAEKGAAVKKQRQTFDAVLNGRIRLQQGLVVINTLPTIEKSEDGVADYGDALRNAEQAAVRLWNTIESLKSSFDGERSGSKRKHLQLSSETPLADCWRHMEENEKDCRLNRRNVLQKWSTKTQGVSVQPAARKLISGPQQTTIVNVLDENLSNRERLIKRTRIPRSCAPIQASEGVTESENIFDDADFYGGMLKELLEQRSIDAGANVAADLATSQWQTLRGTKTKKNVDTKASKGRKLRFTVHEKLQNFMAPEDRRSWTERQIDELFGSLLGRRLALGEVEDGQDGEENAEEEALMLFRG